MPTLHISLLGPLHVTVNDHPTAFRTDAERALLAYLATHQGIPQRRDTLAALLSPDRPDQEALTYLRNRLSRLRSALGDALNDDPSTPPWFDVDRKQIALRTGDDIVIDVPHFGRLLATVKHHPHRELAGCPTCLEHLQEAINLVRGELLSGLNFPSDTWESWLLTQREHLQQRALAAMALLCDTRQVRGEWADVLNIAQRQLHLEPWLEAAHRAQMQAHIQLGDRNAALAQYEACQQLLWDELGVEPEEETRALFGRIKAADGIQPPATLALSRAEGRHHPTSTLPDNLPLPSGRFFGRRVEQAHLLQRLVEPSVRLITLVGTGGIGKTRLALEVGKRLKASFPDGVFFLPLDAIQGGAEQIKIAVGEAAGFGQAGLGGTGFGGAGFGGADKQLSGEQVLAILRDKRLLLIFDNCEVMLDEIAFIPTWLKRAPQLAILATSREPLNFADESVVALAGLPIGEGEKEGKGEREKGEREMNAAEAMFAERGQMARADFVLTTENMAQVRHICQLVDGLPLGIALAAAWVRRRSLAQIGEEIGRSLDFLSTRLRDVDPRHRSVRAVFETSWQLLSAAEQAVLAVLSVFPTTFTADAAAQIAGASLDDLDLLCEKSLLQQQIEPARYVMHSLVRQFAAEKLASRSSLVEKESVQRAFVETFYQFVYNHQNDYAALQPEWRNFSEGIRKAHDLKAWQTVLDFVQVLDEPWFRQIRFSEMRAGLGLALDAARALGDEVALARTLLRLGEVEMELNEYAVAEWQLAEAMQHLMRLEDGLGIAQTKYLLGRIKSEQAQDDEALTLFVEAKRIFAEEEDWLGVAKNLNLIALCHIKQSSDYKAARENLEKSISIQQQLPPSSSWIEALRYLARVQSNLGEYGAAADCLAKATNISHAQQDIGEYAAVLFERTVLSRRQNQLDAALRFGYECLDLFRKLGSLRWEALIKTQLGILHQAKMDFPQAVTLFSESLQLFVELGDLYEEAYTHYFLYKLYEAMGDTTQSIGSKQQAIRLNAMLNDLELATRLQ